MNKNYRRGRRLEYIIVDMFNSSGWLVHRSAGSHGIADVIAIKKDVVLLIQCKYGTKPTKDERLKMFNSQSNLGKNMFVVLAYKKPRTKLQFFELDSACKFKEIKDNRFDIYEE